eukprot:CAMPEP_0203745614 /NCGR_PEP_ID=MMETSP0098-20131031/1296_1 /ASSEMBLY_ACC=CAM_ASM_000208 /TAXON_ID=96639 /ORGANISM=" , Strain NY0313808BC1" /LENGTH=61 /DNA_ID=CAMNT_0050633443 /DNA_START=404 /DNA_END=589 /DNA_ORIENTATION=-
MPTTNSHKISQKGNKLVLEDPEEALRLALGAPKTYNRPNKSGPVDNGKKRKKAKGSKSSRK